VRRRLQIHPSADAEVDEAAAWYDAQTTGVGNDFIVAAGTAVRSAARRPRIGSPVSIQSEVGEVRRVRVVGFPYQVVYAVLPDHVTVLAVAHNHRTPGYWASRLDE
jgi:plasmid stabilization system protein ParE